MGASDAQLVGNWAARIAPALLADEHRYGDMWDLDEIFWKTYPAPWDVHRAIQAFEHLVSICSAWSSELVATFVINLVQSAALNIHPSRVDKLESLDVSPHQPPALGLGKKWRPAQVTYEHYRVPIRQQFVDVSSGGVFAHYECWRTAQAMTAREPYSRAIILQHWAEQG